MKYVFEQACGGLCKLFPLLFHNTLCYQVSVKEGRGQEFFNGELGEKLSGKRGKICFGAVRY
jgi:hypothetical protein